MRRVVKKPGTPLSKANKRKRIQNQQVLYRLANYASSTDSLGVKKKRVKIFLGGARSTKETKKKKSPRSWKGFYTAFDDAGLGEGRRKLVKKTGLCRVWVFRGGGGEILDASA